MQLFLLYLFSAVLWLWLAHSPSPPGPQSPISQQVLRRVHFQTKFDQPSCRRRRREQLKTCYRCWSPKETSYLLLLFCLKQQLTNIPHVEKSFISLEQNQSLINDLLGPNCSWAISCTKRGFVGDVRTFCAIWHKSWKMAKEIWMMRILNLTPAASTSNMKICVWQNEDDSSERHRLLVEH